MASHTADYMKRSFVPSITSNCDGKRFMRAEIPAGSTHGNPPVVRKRSLIDTMGSWASLEKCLVNHY
jgi:hypothetical protein